ncbi:MAG: ABC transporter ATP-binding protein [Bacteroidia bacterium]
MGISNYFAVDSFTYAQKAADYIKENIGKTSNDIIIKELSYYALLILLVAVLSGVFLFLTRQTIIVMSRLIEYDLKNEVFAKYQELDLAFYKRHNTGDMMNRISEDVSRVRMYIGPAVMYILNTGFRVLFSIVAMIAINPELTVYVLLPLPILVVSIYIVSQKINQKSTEIQEQLSDITTHTQEAFSGIRVLKAYGREDYSTSKFAQESDAYRTRTIGLVKVESLFQPLMLLLIGLSTIFIVYIGGKLVINGEISFGNIIKFVLLVNSLTWPITSLGWVTSLVQRAAASQTRINQFLKTRPDIINPTLQHTVIEGDIEFKNVSFTYPDSGIKALDNVSFKVKKGSSLAIIGATGAGKSTIANLMCRLYNVDSGEILLDGKNITELNLNDIRQQTGYVPQEVFLFSDTIANNIRFGLHTDKNTSQLVEQAARNAAVYSNIMEFPAKFETIVGERGITLSGGQKQRISIARAIIKEPKLLIFDDCLSAVDTETEEEILNNLKKLMKGRTSVIISHRVSSVKSADHILVLEACRIAEQGSHQELLALNGIYAELTRLQQLANAL